MPRGNGHRHRSPRPAALVPAFAAALVLSVPACRSHGAAPSAVTDAAAAVPAASTDLGQVLARVGDRTITLGDYVAALDHMDQFDRLRYRAPERRRELLDQMIDVALLADEARERGYDKDPQAQQEVREILRDAVLAKVRAESPGPQDMPEPEVRAYYDAHAGDFRDPERRRVSAIVTNSESAAASALAAAQATDASGWGQIVRSRSVDPGAKADVPLDLAGDLGFVNAPGVQGDRGENPRVPPEVRTAIFEVPNVGEVLPRVVKAGDKFYVVKLVSKSDAHVRSLQDAERTIRVKLAQDKLHAKEAALLDQLRQEFPVTIDEAALAQVRVGDAGR